MVYRYKFLRQEKDERHQQFGGNTEKDYIDIYYYLDLQEGKIKQTQVPFAYKLVEGFNTQPKYFYKSDNSSKNYTYIDLTTGQEIIRDNPFPLNLVKEKLQGGGKHKRIDPEG
jgi:hypothetical protein